MGCDRDVGVGGLDTCFCMSAALHPCDHHQVVRR